MTHVEVLSLHTYREGEGEGEGEGEIFYFIPNRNGDRFLNWFLLDYVVSDFNCWTVSFNTADRESMHKEGAP